MYIFVRQDIPIQQQLVQSSHAALTLGSFMEISGIPNIVLIGVPDMAALLRVRDKLITHRIDYVLWEEPDFDFGVTAIATEPLSVERKEPLNQYRLWRYSSPVAQPAEQPAALKSGRKKGVRDLPGEPDLPKCASSLVAESARL